MTAVILVSATAAHKLSFTQFAALAFSCFVFLDVALNLVVWVNHWDFIDNVCRYLLWKLSGFNLWYFLRRKSIFGVCSWRIFRSGWLHSTMHIDCDLQFRLGQRVIHSTAVQATKKQQNIIKDAIGNNVQKNILDLVVIHSFKRLVWHHLPVLYLCPNLNFKTAWVSKEIIIFWHPSFNNLNVLSFKSVENWAIKGSNFNGFVLLGSYSESLGFQFSILLQLKRSL